MEKLHLRELPESGAALNFLLPTPQKPIFGNNRVEVTRKAADTFAEVFRKIIARKEDRTRAQRSDVKGIAAKRGTRRGRSRCGRDGACGRCAMDILHARRRTILS